MMMIRIIIALAVLTCPAWADHSEPLSYSIASTWKGRVVADAADPSRLLVVSPRPVWSGSSPALTVIGVDGRSRISGFLGQDVRDAMPWSNGFLVARVEYRRVIVSLVDRQLSTLPSSEIIIEADADVDAATIVRVLGAPSDPIAVVQVGSSVVAVQRFDGRLYQTPLEQNVFAVAFLQGQGRSRIALAYTIGASAFLTVIDSTLQAMASTSVPSSESARIEQVGPYVMMLSTLEGASGTVFSLLEPTTFSTGTRAIPVDQSLIRPIWLPTGMVLAMLTTRNGVPELVITDANDVPEVLPRGTTIPGDYGSAKSVVAHGDTIVVVFTGGLVTMLLDGTIISRDAMPLSVGATSESFMSGTRLVVSSRTTSYLLDRSTHTLWFLWRALDTVLRFVVPLVLVLLLITVWLLYWRQRRFFDAMIDIPGAGLVFVLDGNGRLVRTNERAAKLLRITKSVPMRRLFRSYTQRSGLEPLTHFLSQVQTSRAALSEKIAITESHEQREYVFTSVPLIGLVGRSVGSIITGVDITEALERRRLVNWAQLAHDMQTNLSTIRLNAEQLGDDGDPRNTERRRRILFQVGVLIQRVRDLVSVGRSEDIMRIPVHSAELCTEIRHEFDPAMFPHVTFAMKLRGTMMNVDRLKVSRAVRNAVENAIKSLRGKPGTVEIATWFDRANVFIRVSDTGVGMDAETMSNMMKPYFTTAKDGTGTGIGTMIMQHVMNLHGGSLRVSSEPGVGTQVIFRLPHEMDVRQRAGRALEEVEA
ncbi:MAG: HAMP domain-containing histidine kinase [Ignavibacteria bacterium]|nr:HAMP domain-containing histidine kinase [Ignavibacteria bacterium]MBK7411653.1 HAMP domain-containing histidine kinase [Ignavibacteria bacterium]